MNTLKEKQAPLIIERHVIEQQLTTRIIERYSQIYGDVVAYSQATFGGFFIYTRVDFGRQIVIL